MIFVIFFFFFGFYSKKKIFRLVLFAKYCLLCIPGVHPDPGQ